MTFDQIPEEAKDIIFDEKNPQINGQIADAFNLTSNDLDNVLDLLMQVMTKEIPVLEFPVALARLNMKDVNSGQLALEFALKRLWPLQNFLGSVDILIRRLGGEVPQFAPKIVKAATSPENVSVLTDARKFMEGASKLRYLLLTRTTLRNEQDKIIDPTIENWLKDYLRYAGEAPNDSLTRSEYLVKSRNAASLANDDKQNLLNFLISYGDQASMEFSISDGFLTVASETESKSEARPEIDLQESLQKYKEEAANFQSLVSHNLESIKLETDGQTSQLADILWRCLGLGEQDRALTTLYLLVDKQMLANLLKEDQRFIGIVRRYINVRFGSEAKTFWEPQQVTAIYWGIFFSLVFEEKLKFSASQSAVMAHYLCQKMGMKNKPVYLDKASGVFRFREIDFSDKKFKFAD